jgi:hypothetical protein
MAAQRQAEQILVAQKESTLLLTKVLSVCAKLQVILIMTIKKFCLLVDIYAGTEAICLFFYRNVV